VSNRNAQTCASCRAGRAKTINGSLGKCHPWHGEFDMDEVTPLTDDGVAMLPGYRKCGKQDCVNPDHIEREV